MPIDYELTARILARALREKIDVRDLAARLWEVPGEATAFEIQVLAAYYLIHNKDAGDES